MAFSTLRPAQIHNEPPTPTSAHTTGYSAVAWAALTVLAGSATAAAGATLPDTFQMSPSGYSGAIKTPTADVLPMGSAAISITNDNPDLSPLRPESEPLGSMNVGFGLFPGLELVSRLLYRGDLQCNSFLPGCLARRDLSLSGKYQLPLLLPNNTRVAVGFTDFGGAKAATFFKQTYGVATSTYGPIDLSLGYSPKSATNAKFDDKYHIELLNGIFGSAIVRATDNLAVIVEADSSSTRLGTHYTIPLRQDIDVQLGVSRKTRGEASRQSTQMTATLHYMMDKKLKEASQLKRPAWENSEASAQPATLDQRALALANRMAADGFANIHIAALPAADGQPLLWWVQADPVGWRKDHQQALGAGLVNWMLNNEADDAEVVLSLTYMGQPTSSVYTSRSCLQKFAMGQDTCQSMKTFPINFLSGTDLPMRLQNGKAEQTLKLVSNAAPFAWKPQVELGLNLRSTVGTEFGLADYSAALSLGAQVELDNLGMPEDWKKGWMWQGNLLIPVSRSEDFEKNQPFYIAGHQKTELEQGLLSYWRYVDTPWLKKIAVQGSVGSVNTYSRGGQLDAMWMNEAGDFRIGATAGAYSRRKMSGERNTHIPALLSMRQSVVPGQWHLEGSFGKFLAGDTGYKITSHHWYGDYRLSFFLRETKGSTSAMPKTRFAGFEISLPFGPKTSLVSNAGSVRSQDRWGWGLTTKIATDINYQTYGYGEIPRPRHGVWSDVTDHDRSGPADMLGRKDTLRSALQNTDQ